MILLQGNITRNYIFLSTGEKMNSYWKYEVRPERRYNPDLGWYDTYMLLAKRKIPIGWEEIEIIHDVTTKYTLAWKIAAFCTECQLPPIHTRSVIETIPL